MVVSFGGVTCNKYGEAPHDPRASSPTEVDMDDRGPKRLVADVGVWRLAEVLFDLAL